MGLMEGKKGLVVGIANERSLVWGIAQALHREGASLAFTYASELFKKRVNPLAKLLGSSFVHEMDVTDDKAMDRVFEAYESEFGAMDFFVHGVAFSDKGELKGPYYNTSRANFLMTMDVSVYSFTAMARRAQHIMPDGGAILTLTYYGSQKAVPNYNVMGVAKAGLEASVRYLAVDLGERGIRVNAISAGPVKTLASSGVANFKDLMRRGVEGSPMKRKVTIDEVGNAALYLLSGLSTAVTGEVLFVDAGFHASVG